MGSGPFRSPLLRASRLISLPPGTEMFQFPGFALRSKTDDGLTPSRVAPFGHLGITACVPLPRAYRSLPRPSSPPCAQASPTCLRSLDYNNLSSSRTTRDLFRSTSDVIRLTKRSHLNKDSSNPTIYHYFRCQTAIDAITASEPSAASNNRESNWDMDVSRRATYEKLSALPERPRPTRDPLRR